MLKKIVLLGSTGSIGVQTLEIIRSNPDKFEVLALSCFGSNMEAFKNQIEQFKPKYAKTEKFDGGEQVSNLAQLDCDIVLNAITGSAGILSSAKALQSGNYLALANKESLVAGGDYLMSLKQFDEQIIPVDSEHSAVFQCLGGSTQLNEKSVSRLILTASGGPFYSYTKRQLQNVTKEQALNHPTWKMGPVVTINSSTLVNKALEVIEAYYLFDIAFDKIDVAVQPKSLIHSMVEFLDGSTLMQLSPPNMKLPISLALNYPERLKGSILPQTFEKEFSLDFKPLDNEKFPIVEFIKAAMQDDKRAGIVFNAANEEIVSAFLNGKIKYINIVPLLENVIENYKIEHDIVNIGNIKSLESSVRQWVNCKLENI
ncbi:MAG: 1-deoxy-D-xylulose-5-phosphate reductoisomerase [Bifidobacteriaceae bacterium]|jgi:1-deoxy-D-xylulose-5-phosphate reductoisomerase|nr:1-deoxy-D-xylulose-5-phosphate reductoisomerase [Bifidobacteriaceae bacterium]